MNPWGRCTCAIRETRIVGHASGITGAVKTNDFALTSHQWKNKRQVRFISELPCSQSRSLWPLDEQAYWPTCGEGRASNFRRGIARRSAICVNGWAYSCMYEFLLPLA